MFDNSPLDVTSRSITDAMQVLHVVRPRQDKFWCSEGGQHYRMVVEPPVDGTLQDLMELGSMTEKDVKQMVRLVYRIISWIISYGPRPVGKHAHHNFDLIDAQPLQFICT
ncbi:uncharacterized protein ACA1_301380 [Acanthamoeba castellanii str. Neff]|uniref:Uncharacterized protein n=1 Tax=Acanthamoeba castellanii (strain ATCC 30010 / Neff) TaxID=1257118 RepID=L8GLS1_ACACF|nr:uncharacterized protein ACA1_301380 [Acanthamoeba castellanii str. Neff]ELR13136.1 hypothetical protein ACA1_301380 [Acanthamoeba castellanii str. Neff]